mgnify:CR=1 FL=1
MRGVERIFCSYCSDCTGNQTFSKYILLFTILFSSYLIDMCALLTRKMSKSNHRWGPPRASSVKKTLFRIHRGDYVPKMCSIFARIHKSTENMTVTRELSSHTSAVISVAEWIVRPFRTRKVSGSSHTGKEQKFGNFSLFLWIFK